MFVGVDVHKHSLFACYYRNSEEFRFRSFPFTKNGFQEFLASLGREDQVAIEAVGQAYYLVDQMKARVRRIVVVNTYAFDVIKRSRSKTDAKDAFLLAQHLSYGHLPEVHLPSRDIRDLRSYIRARTALLEERTRLKNRIHAAFLMHGIVTVRKQLNSAKGRAALRQESESYGGYPEMDLVPMHLDRIGQLEEQMKVIEEKMLKLGIRLPDLPRLLEICGISPLMAVTILAEVGDFRRFGSASQVSSYAGLVPATRRSGSRVRTGRAGYGRKHLRTALVRVVQTMVAHEPTNPLVLHYQRLKLRRGAGRATVAVARKLLEILWIIVTQDVQYREVNNTLYQKKLEGIGLAA